MPHQKRAGTPGQQDAAGRDKRNLDKVMLHRCLVHGTWEQKVGISSFTPLYEGEQGGTVETCGLANEQHVLLLPPQQQTLNKVQLRLGHQRLAPLWERGQPKLLS